MAISLTTGDAIMNVNDLLAERGRTHGHFPEHAAITQNLKDWCRAQRNWSILTPAQREALDMIAHKIGRILAGDPNFEDHWADISGYSTLAEQEIASLRPAEPQRRDYSKSKRIHEILNEMPPQQAAE